MQDPTSDAKKTNRSTTDTVTTRGAGEKMTSSHDFTKLKELYTAAGQGQVFRFEEKLNEEEKIAFYEQLQTIDVEDLAKKYAAATNPCTYSIIPATRIAFSS
jgi:hypothetical protein